jgi:hypothetical protein
MSKILGAYSMINLIKLFKDDAGGEVEKPKFLEKPENLDVSKGKELKFSSEVVIKAFSAPQRLFYGIVYEPGVEDSHGDFTSADEIEKAAHNFLPNAVMNIHHRDDLDVEKVQVVESYIALADFFVGENKIRKGSWVLVSKVLDDELATAIEKGEITGYSLEGTAVRIEY